jgi:hypothetical protein
MRKVLAVKVVLLVVCAWGITAQGDSLESDSLVVAKQPKVTAAPIRPVSAMFGKLAKVEFLFRVEPGFHVNSNQPRDELLQPTTLKLSPPTDIVVGRVSYPLGKDMTFAFMPGQTLSVYTGDFSITAVVTPTRSVTPGTYRVHGALKYQACDNRQCFAPKEVPVDFDVKVTRGIAKSSHSRRTGQSPHVH